MERHNCSLLCLTKASRRTLPMLIAPTADVVIGGLAALWEIRRWPKI